MTCIFNFLLPALKEGDEDQFGEVRDEHSDEDSEGEEAELGSTLQANVSATSALNNHYIYCQNRKTKCIALCLAWCHRRCNERKEKGPTSSRH